MTETRLGLIVAVALSVMGAMDLLRHTSVGSAVADAMFGIEIVAIVVGIVALFWWARLRERRKKV